MVKSLRLFKRVQRLHVVVLFFLIPLSCLIYSSASHRALIYSNDFLTPEHVSDWVMEGPGQLKFKDGWMEMYSPYQKMHHVYWCPETFPESFVAEWQVQNLNPEAGLLIIFFAATGLEGQDIFDTTLVERDGRFFQYIQGDLKSYHISYYANAEHNPDRGSSNLRKNNTFSLLQSGPVGIPTHSTAVHTIKLLKRKEHIRLFVDDREVINYRDRLPVVNGVNIGSPLLGGKIGFRQMRWSHFRYRNFRVYAL
jgi:hypothetical protein